MMSKEKKLLTEQGPQTLGPKFDASIQSRVRVAAAIRRAWGFGGSVKWETPKEPAAD